MTSIKAMMNIRNIHTSRISRKAQPWKGLPHQFSPWRRVLAFSLVLCCLWSFGLAGVALAAHQPVLQQHNQKPHSLWMPPAKIALMQAQARKVKAMQSRAARPGFPYRQAAAQAARQAMTHPLSLTPRSTPITLLDQVGLLSRPIPAPQVASWYAESKSRHLAPARAALLNLWLGEWELAHNQHPQVARPLFRQARRLSRSSDNFYGLASYDDAIALFYEGDYADATDAFSHLMTIQSGLRGYDRRSCALWLRHANACASYHAARAALGIPEPPRLDPLCGVAALAACLRSLGMPSDKETLLKASHVTGEGNTLSDIADAAKKLGASAYSVTANEQALVQMPLPMVAYVEHDHFVALVRADKSGVSYLCSDCGAWPGGRVNLTWRQWRQMNPGLYLAVTKPGSAWDQRMMAAKSGQFMPQVRVAMADPTDKFSRPLLLHITGRSLPRGAVVLQHNSTFVQCGGRFHGLRCVNPQCCYTQAGGSSGSLGGHGSGPGGYGSGPHPMGAEAVAAGPAADDPVNLASGEEEYTPTDLTIYNPHGPSVVWGRIYDSLAGDNTSSPESSDFGTGWSQTYNVGVLDTNGGSGNYNFKYVYYPNGSRLAFTASAVPNAATPSVLCTPEPGADFLVYWNYDAVTTKTYFQVVFGGRSQWVTAEQSAGGGYFLLSKEVDRNGNYLNFNYTTTDTNFPLLSTITNQDGTILMSILRVSDGTGNIAQISDCYGRSIFYHVEKSVYGQNNSGLALDHVSQIVPTGTAAPPDRYVYGYLMSEVPEGYNYNVLHTITVPSPTGSSTSTATINYNTTMYAPNQMLVSSLVDGNGNTTTFTSVDGNSNAASNTNYTQVTFTAPGSSTPAYTYTVSYDNNMSGLTKTDGAGRVTSTSVYSDPSNPYRPSSVTDGNGNVTHYVWDQFGNMHEKTSPRGTVTNYTYAFPSGQVPSVVNSVAATGAGFALGEMVSEQEGTKTATTYSYYEPSGLPQVIISPLPGTNNSSQTVTLSCTYDSLGNLLTVTTPGNNDVATITTTFTYGSIPAIGQPVTMTDNLGKKMNFVYDAQGNLLSSTDALGNQTTMTYTISNALLSTIFPATHQTGSGDASSQTNYTYTEPPVNATAQWPVESLQYGPAAITTQYDENGIAIRSVVNTYGNEGEILSITGSTEPVTYTYDPCYRLSTVKDAANNITSYFYNVAGYLQQIVYPGAQSVPPTIPLAAGHYDTITFGTPDNMTVKGYDALGNILTRTDGRGIVTNYVYNDAESLLTEIQYPASTSLNVHFNYDKYGRRGNTIPGGFGMSDSTGSVAYTYDDRDNLTSVITAYNGLPSQTISYGYYPDNRRQSMITPAGNFSYRYDGDSRMTSVTNPFNEVSSWTYLDNSWLNSQTLANGVITTYERNSLNQLVELTTRTSNGALLADFAGPSGLGSSMGYDGARNRVSITVNMPSAPSAYSGATNYQYDTKNQLSKEQSSRNNSFNSMFAYDAAGNPTLFRNQSVGNATADNQLPNNVYDGNGDPVTYKGQALQFDPEDHVTQFGNVLTAGYTGDGTRAWKQGSGGKTYFLYDGMVPVCEIDASGAVTATNTTTLQGLLSRHTASSSVFYTFDPQGNTVERLDENANVLATYLYDAYGSKVGTDTSSDPYSGFGGQWSYYEDNETGLYLLTHRYYDPQNGRFLTRDPMSYEGGINTYAYVQNNPITNTDVYGLLPCLPYMIGICEDNLAELPPGTCLIGCSFVPIKLNGGEPIFRITCTYRGPNRGRLPGKVRKWHTPSNCPPEMGKCISDCLGDSFNGPGGPPCDPWSLAQVAFCIGMCTQILFHKRK